MGGAVLAGASPAADGTVAAVVGVEVVVAAAATVDVCGADNAAPANAMGFWEAKSHKAEPKGKSRRSKL